MGWFRRKRKAKAGAPSSAGGRGAATPAPRASVPLFETDEDAERPVNLAGELQTCTPGASAKQDLEGELSRLLGQPWEDGDRAFLERLLSELQSGDLQLPPMPEAVLRVQRMIDSPDCSTSALAQELELDPALATRMVGVANSPFYAGLEAVDSVRDAVVRIGLAETRNIVMAITLRSKVFRVPGFDDKVKQLWQHALGSSVAAQLLAAEAGMDPDPAFLAGLVHDVGRVAIFSLAADVQRRSRGAHEISYSGLSQVSDQLHARLGAVITDAWRVSSTISTAIAHHHEPDAAAQEARLLASVLAAADLLAQRVLSPSDDASPSEEEWQQALGRIGIDGDEADAFADEVSEAISAFDKTL
jgi:putative nucleotidyltransferase with HDIG domain